MIDQKSRKSEGVQRIEVVEDNRYAGLAGKRSRIGTGGENRGRKHPPIVDEPQNWIAVDCELEPDLRQGLSRRESFHSTKSDSVMLVESLKPAVATLRYYYILNQVRRTASPID